jgi:hypothetical protein
VAVAIHLEDISKLAIDHQPAHAEARVVVEPANLLGVAALLDQFFQRRLDAERLQILLFVERQRVVHVEADEIDLVHPQVAVDVDAARPLHVERARHRVPERLQKLEMRAGFVVSVGALADGHEP